MPILEIVKQPPRLSLRKTWEDVRTYIGPQNKRAVFRNPTEFHMGAYSWDLEVLDESSKKLGARTDLLCPAVYQPWSHEGNSLFVVPVRRSAELWELATGASVICEVDGVVGCVGSRRLPRFVVTAVRKDCLVGPDGKLIRELDLRRPSHAFPFVSWFDAAGQVLAVESAAPGLATIRFFRGDGGEALEEHRCDPSVLFPYDEAAYEGLKRDSWSLVLSPAMQCLGALLDQWSAITFDESAGALRMMVYRPKGEPFEGRAQRVCEVEEKWVEVRMKA